MLAKFHRNILNLSENIAKSFRGLLFLTHTVCAWVVGSVPVVRRRRPAAPRCRAYVDPWWRHRGVQRSTVSVPAVTGQRRASDVTAHAYYVMLVAGDIAHVSVQPHITYTQTHKHTHRHIQPTASANCALGRKWGRFTHPIYASRRPVPL